MNVLWGHNEAVAEWVGWRIPYVAKRMARAGPHEPFGPAVAAGVLNSQGQLVAGVVFHNYDPDCPSIELSFASTTAKWLTRGIICELLRYCFDELKVRRCTAVTPRKTATSARRFLEHFGFRREGIATEAFGNEDAIISRLLRREWLATKWAKPLPERREARMRAHGQAETSSSA